MLSRMSALLALLLGSLPGLLPGAPAVDPPALSLPAGPAAEAWSRVAADTELPEDAIAPWPQWSDRSERGWGSAAPWKRWVELVRTEATGESDPRRRAALALLARARGRDLDAWAHFEACGDDPRVLAALAPSFFPGTPLDHPGLAGGLPTTLPDGALLRPALPPRPFLEEGRPEGLVEHALEHGGFQIGESMIAMKLLLERDGVQVDLHHLEGPPVTVRVLLPVPAGEEIGVAYVDWYRQDAAEVPLEVRLSASEEEASHELWGRFRAKPIPWPSRLPATLPAQVELAGLAVRVSPELFEQPWLGHLARSLGELLGTPARLESAVEAPDGDLGPLTIHLAPGDGFEREVAAMLSLAEAFVLSAGDED